jgi:hypothetical protein
MRSFFAFISLSLFISLTAVGQTKVGDVTIPNTFKAGNTNLVLNGAGIREKYFFDLYVGALYIEAKSTDAATILNADKPMAVKLHIISGMVDKEKMVEAIMEGFKKSTGGNVAPYQSRIDQLLNAFTAIKVGDVFDLSYEPGKGISLSKNGTVATTVTGLDFKKALFGIWMGTDPVDKDLKKKMLGTK